jgi:ABC-type transport system involved in multi-copper enzyme maturation permease subunit
MVGIVRTITRVNVIASNVFREVLRDRVLYFLVFYAAALLLGNWMLPHIASVTDRKILLDLSLAAMQVLGLVLVFFVGSGLINREIEKRTIVTLMAKPVRRSELIFGKHLGLMGVLAVLIAAMTAIYILTMEFTRTPYPQGATLLSCLFLWLQLSLVGAMAIGFGTIMSTLLATMMTIATYFIGILTPDLVSLGKATKNATIEQVTRAMYLVLPDLSRLDLKNGAVYNILPAAGELVQSAAYGILYTVLILTFSSFVFSRREF